MAVDWGTFLVIFMISFLVFLLSKIYYEGNLAPMKECIYQSWDKNTIWWGNFRSECPAYKDLPANDSTMKRHYLIFYYDHSIG